MYTALISAVIWGSQIDADVEVLYLVIEDAWTLTEAFRNAEFNAIHAIYSVSESANSEDARTLVVIPVRVQEPWRPSSIFFYKKYHSSRSSRKEFDDFHEARCLNL